MSQVITVTINMKRIETDDPLKAFKIADRWVTATRNTLSRCYPDAHLSIWLSDHSAQVTAGGFDGKGANDKVAQDVAAHQTILDSLTASWLTELAGESVDHPAYSSPQKVEAR